MKVRLGIRGKLIASMMATLIPEPLEADVAGRRFSALSCQAPQGRFLSVAAMIFSVDTHPPMHEHREDRLIPIVLALHGTLISPRSE